MVTTKHFCNICKKGYKRKTEAIDCEAQGIMGMELEPGLALKRNGLKGKKLHDRLFVVLKKERLGIQEFKHYLTYSTAQFDFAQGRGEYDWMDRWNEKFKKSQEIEEALRSKKLSPLTDKDMGEMESLLSSWRDKIHQALKDPLSGPESYKAYNETQIIESLEKYGITNLYTGNPFE